ncbi:hypothetical protein LTR37_008866 [Vermiconidia calcicola]|uniref:Uncharacterized protein n=1 Tax=Vermiconidia calcicola TaxID=1690605 RepID=A0ACC3NAT8_9PEZI|nr:hypothetical protein LTR37_008866 [Vermiconidia calcicola]
MPALIEASEEATTTAAGSEHPPTGNAYDIATRAQIVTLKQYTKLGNAEISAITGATPRQIQRYIKTAEQRGWTEEQKLLDNHVDNA